MAAVNKRTGPRAIRADDRGAGNVRFEFAIAGGEHNESFASAREIRRRIGEAGGCIDRVSRLQFGDEGFAPFEASVGLAKNLVEAGIESSMTLPIQKQIGEDARRS